MASTSGPGVIGPGMGIGSASGKNKSGPAHAFIGPDNGEFAVVNGHGVLGHGHAARHGMYCSPTFAGAVAERNNV